MVNIKIHRGTNQIGGTITEIYTENTHLFIDFGAELSNDVTKSSDKQMVEMIKKAECDAVLFSHYHGDHIGLMGEIPAVDVRGREIMLGMGLCARKVLIRIHKACKDDDENRKMLSLLKDGKRFIDFENKKTFTVGDFTITTVRVDHSAYDAYMFLIEAEGKLIVHTGDYRTHGRLGKRLFPDLKEALGDRRADVLITEGTMIERSKEKIITEKELEEKAKHLLEKPENKWAFLVCSSTNMESLASFCNAARSLDRPFIVNHYVYEQILGYRKSAGKEDWDFKFLKAYKFENMDVVNEKLGNMTQPEYMMENGFLMLVGTSDSYEKRMNYFKEKNPLLIYSMWEGYIDKENYPDTYVPEYGKLVNDWRVEKLHTSGHASIEAIEEMIATVNPVEGIIPIHTTKKEQFKELNIGEINVIELEDGGFVEL